MNFVKFLRMPLFTEHFWWLLLNEVHQDGLVLKLNGHLTSFCRSKDVESAKNEKKDSFALKRGFLFLDILSNYRTISIIPHAS